MTKFYLTFFIVDIILKSTNTNKLTITMVEPVGDSYTYDVYKPMINEMIDKNKLDNTTLLNFLKSCIDDNVGKMIKLDIKRAPTNFIPNTTMIEHNDAKIMLYNSVLMPIDLANLSSKVIAKILLYEKIYSIITINERIILIITSRLLTDNILPNKYVFISVLTPPIEIINVPIASDEAEIRAILASPLILLFSLIFKMKNEIIIAVGMANSKGAIPSTVATAKAPNPTCDKPSPIIEFFLNTNDTPTRLAHIDINIPTTKARIINGYDNISYILLIIMYSPYKFFSTTHKYFVFS